MFRASSSSTAVKPTTAGTLPLLSTAIRYLLARLPRVRFVRGDSSAVTTGTPAMCSMASSTTEPAGSSFDTTRTANATGPSGRSGVTGGRTVIRTVPVWPGNNDSAAGSHTVHGAAGPSGVKVNESTTPPVLRTDASNVASPPGVTNNWPGVSVASAPMAGKVRRRRVPRAGGDGAPGRATRVARWGSSEGQPRGTRRVPRSASR